MNKRFRVSGMHCASCETLINEEIKILPGVTDVRTDAKEGICEVSMNQEMADEIIIGAIKTAGYEAVAQTPSFSHSTPPENTAPLTLVEQEDNKVTFHYVNETTGEGTVTMDEAGKPAFKGTLRQQKSGTVTFPANLKDKAQDFTRSFETLLQEKNSSSVGGIVSQQKEKTVLSEPKQVPEKEKRVTFRLSGMHCTSCAGIITKSLKKLPGIAEAQVSFTSEKALVSFDPHQTSESTIIAQIKKAGYRAEVAGAANPDEDRVKRQAEIHAYRRKFLFGAILSLPMMYFMFLDFFSFLPARGLLLPWMGIVSFILTTPVQLILGAGFYKGMWSSLRMKTFNMDSLIAIGTSAAFL